MRLDKYGSFVLLVLLLMIGCGKDNNSNTTIQEGKAGGSILVNVSDGNPKTQPIYTWTHTLLDGNSDITASRVTVVPTTPNNASPVWDVVDTTLQDSIHLPVVHGPSPFGSVQQVTTPELDLQTNVWYRVTVTKGDQTTAGFREFLILP